MTFEEYWQSVPEPFYPNRGANLVYPVLGLVGEAGEVAEKVKKLQRDHGGKLTPEYRDAIVKELGDVLWYIAAFADELDVTLEDVAKANIEKLQGRAARGTRSGEGDDR